MIQKILLKFLFLLSLSLNLFASEYVWSVSSSKKDAFVNEAIHLKYVCEFNDRAELYTIEFNPVTENETYDLQLYTQDTSIRDGKKISTYEYIAFVKKPMLMEFSFEALMKKTNRDSIENTVLGRDNADYEESLVTKVKQENVQVLIKKTDTEISGKYSIDVKKDTPELKAYKPFHLDIKISGTGNFDAIQAIVYDIKNVKVFAQKPIKNIRLDQEGYKGTWNQKFAFVAQEDFIIPARSIEYFDIKSQEIKSLDIDAIDVKLKEAYKKSELLDEENSISFISIFEGSQKYFYYLLTFLAGFLLAKIKLKSKSKDTKSTQLKDKVQNTKSLNELSMLLILNNQRKFNDILTKIDSKELSSLSKAKDQAIKLIRDV